MIGDVGMKHAWVGYYFCWMLW